MIIEAPADLVETNNVGAELSQRHAAERRGDKGRELDNTQVAEELVHAAY
jgi:hypothetical protein